MEKADAVKLRAVQKRDPCYSGLFSNAYIVITAGDPPPILVIGKSPSLRLIMRSEELTAESNVVRV